jgi:hypothetical protein
MDRLEGGLLVADSRDGALIYRMKDEKLVLTDFKKTTLLLARCVVFGEDIVSYNKSGEVVINRLEDLGIVSAVNLQQGGRTLTQGLLSGFRFGQDRKNSLLICSWSGSIYQLEKINQPDLLALQSDILQDGRDIFLEPTPLFSGLNPFQNIIHSDILTAYTSHIEISTRTDNIHADRILHYYSLDIL